MPESDICQVEKYKSEAKEKWGKTDAYKEHEAKTVNYSGQKWNEITEGMEHIMQEFAFCMDNDKCPDSDEAQNLVKVLQSYISENFYLCTKEILSGLGQMYIADERFRNNIDKYANGTAAFISEAIEVYCK